MAVAGLHKASGLDSYLGNKERLTTRTSSIRKMWRDLENEGRVKENERLKMSGVVIGPESPCSSSLECESMESEDTLRGADEIENECPQSQNRMVLQEKEGVSKIFHEWGSKSFGGHTVYSSSRLNNECKRVKIVREWIESSTQHGDTCRTTGSEESTAQIGPQIDGSRSSIRRIYGRQALLDLLTKFVRERKREVDDLVENKFVSNFSHRHRIQSLLKGRFLRNQRFVEDEKQTSIAASELGFLRQTHAVSDIRKGFLTRLNNYGHAAESDSDTSSDNEINNYDRVEQPEEIVQEMPHEISKNFETTNLTSHNPPEFPCAAGAVHDNNILQYEEREKLPFTDDQSPRGAQSDSDTSSDNDMTNEQTEQVVGEEFEITNFTSNWESTNPQECTRSESQSDSESESESVTSSDNDMTIEQTEQVVGEEFETTNFTSNWESTNPQECTRSESQSDSESESDTSSDSDMKFDHTDQAEEIVHEIPDASHNPQESNDDGGWYQETVGSDFQESQEEEWYGNDNVVLDPTESWFGGNNSYLEAALVSRSNTFYWLDDDDDDDNGNRVVELRELTNRRSVSNLLQSDFGARLDQLMQSYVSRQDQAFESENEWLQDQDQSPDGNANGIDASPQTHGDHDLHGAVDSQFPDSDYHLVTEIINGLRIDMETLEQRMNEMQKMLEACMDVQFELQRSVQQEIHSALNRSTSRGAFEDGNDVDCFLCCDDGSESLPDRLNRESSLLQKHILQKHKVTDSLVLSCSSNLCSALSLFDEEPC
ncbi:hypothetical protein L1987_00487 [Smallanthus sonchifolius]|uniref:Uncharacterized protein n=1 Tax=Smallanthus sonchifolius TaxID=185202 RepID=A0ACB9K2F3_9ASTR|nr:hypothetical protein L1987_00487 [Smallanthus sonchifolius]